MSNLNKQKGVALYIKVEEYIEEKIEKGEWPKGSQIPSEPELSEYFEVSRSTIRQAISDLVQRGLLIRKQGSGTFVAEPSFEGNFIKFYFPEEFGNCHKLLKINHIKCSSSVARSLQLSQDSMVTEICRLRYIRDEKEPAILEKSYFDSALFQGMDEQDLSRKIYGIIEKNYGIKLVKAKIMVEPVLLNKSDAAFLGVSPGSPVLLLSRVCYTYEDKPIILTKSLVRADKCKLIVAD